MTAEVWEKRNVTRAQATSKLEQPAGAKSTEHEAVSHPAGQRFGTSLPNSDSPG